MVQLYVGSKVRIKTTFDFIQCDRDQMNLYPLGKSKGTLTLAKFYHLNFAHIVLFKRQLRKNVFLLPDVERCSNENVPHFWYLFY